MTPEFWLGLMKEEVAEVEKAAADLFKEISDFGYVFLGLQNLYEGPRELTEAVQEAVDGYVRRFEHVTSLFEDTPPELVDEAFRRVHDANMRKLGFDGKPVRCPKTGKILKGPRYRPPDLLSLVVAPDE
jgi:predicted HAD superfamily Cof-like phosphohydrolase